MPPDAGPRAPPRFATSAPARPPSSWPREDILAIACEKLDARQCTWMLDAAAATDAAASSPVSAAYRPRSRRPRKSAPRRADDPGFQFADATASPPRRAFASLLALLETADPLDDDDDDEADAPRAAPPLAACKAEAPAAAPRRKRPRQQRGGYSAEEVLLVTQASRKRARRRAAAGPRWPALPRPMPRPMLLP